MVHDLLLAMKQKRREALVDLQLVRKVRNVWENAHEAEGPCPSPTLSIRPTNLAHQQPSYDSKRLWLKALCWRRALYHMFLLVFDM